MTFEEDFPSLKHLGLNKGLSDIESVLVKDTLKHCLDKQKVKDAWKKLTDKLNQKGCLDEFEEELGLE